MFSYWPPLLEVLLQRRRRQWRQCKQAASAMVADVAPKRRILFSDIPSKIQNTFIIVGRVSAATTIAGAATTVGRVVPTAAAAVPVVTLAVAASTSATVRLLLKYESYTF